MLKTLVRSRWKPYRTAFHNLIFGKSTMIQRMGHWSFMPIRGASTTNSAYSRTELREQMVPGSTTTNWTFAQGGRMKGALSVPEIARDANGNEHRIIIMQIHNIAHQCMG